MMPKPKRSASITSGLREQCYTLCSLNNEPICLVALISHAPAACESGGVGIDMPFVQLQDNILIDQCNHISAKKRNLRAFLYSRENNVG